MSLHLTDEDLLKQINQLIENFTRLTRELEEQVLTEIITKYDFFVGSKECKCRLLKILPDGANIIYT